MFFKVGFLVDKEWHLLNSDKMDKEERNMKNFPAREGLPSVPMNPREKEQCNKMLSPAELYKIIVSKLI